MFIPYIYKSNALLRISTTWITWGNSIFVNSFPKDFFKKSTNPTYQKMWRYMESNPENLQDNMSDGIAKVRSSNGKYAFIMETPMAEYWMNQPPCDLQQLDNLQKDYHYGFATAKNAAFLQRVNNAIESLKASNELTKLKDKWWKSDKTCQSSASKVNYVSSYFTIAFVVAFNSFVVRLAWERESRESVLEGRVNSYFFICSSMCMWAETFNDVSEK